MVKRLRRNALRRTRVDPADLYPASCTWERSSMGEQTSITTGTVALLFKPRAIPSVEATTLQIFRVFRAFRG